MVADCEIAVAGGGPAGLTAALFAARHGRHTILLDPVGSGGVILNTERVEDFPGFPEGVPGFELGPRIHEQVANAGAGFELQEVRRIERRGADWAVVTDSGEIVAGAAIVATGSRPAKLGVSREDEFEGKGLSHCASCDGPLYRGKAVAIVGGGDSALLEALELTQHDVQVVLIDADEALSGQETYGRRVRESTQVEIRQNTVVEEILGDGSVDGVQLRDLKTGKTSTAYCSSTTPTEPARSSRLPTSCRAKRSCSGSSRRRTEPSKIPTSWWRGSRRRRSTCRSIGWRSAPSAASRRG